MDAKQRYTEADCTETGFACSIKGKVIVLNCEALQQNCRNQLFYCLCGNGADANPKGCAVFLVSLSNGEFSLKRRNEVLGILKPELLPDSAKLQLSQVRPQGALNLNSHEPKYSGYSFLPDGRYAAGVWLCSEKEVMDYVEMQKPYQHRIMICDRNDFCILEMQDQKLIYPSEKEMKDFQLEQTESGGVQMM